MKRTFAIILSLLFIISSFLFPACTKAPEGESGARKETFSLGQSFGAAIKSDGSLWTWGSNVYGQLGTGGTENASRPVKIMDDAVCVSCGDYHTAAIKSDGSLWTWGGNWWGQLGNGGRSNAKDGLNALMDIQTEPLKVMDGAKEVYCGSTGTVVLRDDGVLLYAGDDEYWTSLLGGDGYDSFREIMTGVTGVCRGLLSGIVRDDSTLWTWGMNEYGQLMTRTTGAVPEPVRVMDDVLCCTSCRGTLAVVKIDGTLWTCGANGAGQLGSDLIPVETSITGEPYSVEPSKIMDDVVDVRCGGDHFLALKKDGSVWAWGGNEFGTVGAENSEGASEGAYCQPIFTEPVKVLEGAAAIDCGYWGSGALKTDGSLWIWGSAGEGAIGNGMAGNYTDQYGRPLQTIPAMSLGEGEVRLP